MDEQKELPPKLNRKLYVRWYAMKDRCTNPEHPRYDDYGGNGVTICDRWKSWDNFREDVQKLPGFTIEGIVDKGMHLDKDYLIPGNKIYSPETCCFLNKEDNNKYKPNQMKEFKATSPLGDVFNVTNQSAFAQIHDLRQTTISDCLSGRVKKHRGWTFEN